jgi:RNA polymerase sigma-70 factor, ECF subfamily
LPIALGSRAEAEDVVQDAYLRWHEADHDAIEEPRRYLGTIVTGSVSTA